MAKETAKKAAAKKEKNVDALEALRQAVADAREAGLEVRLTATKNEEGVTTTCSM